MPDDEIDYAKIRKTNLDNLAAAGFQVAGSLPVGSPEETGVLRPASEIAGRLWALAVTYIYVAAPARIHSSKSIKECVSRNQLEQLMTSNERDTLRRWRWNARRREMNSVGWRLENMLPLAWILGFKRAPTTDGKMLDGEPIGELITQFIGDLDQDLATWLAGKELRPLRKIVMMEDRFYCTHNAVRSAQLGYDTVPQGFHPIANGGVIHERRHALTWALSPGVEWDETDLGT